MKLELTKQGVDMKDIIEIKKRIKPLQQSLVLLSFGKVEDRPILYMNLKKGLNAARRTLLEMKRAQMGITTNHYKT
jgi:hypothetical protein